MSYIFEKACFRNDKHQNFLKVVVHVSSIDQISQTARLYEIKLTVITSLFLSL